MEQLSDIVAERGLLSLICNNPKNIFPIQNYITPTDFYTETHQMLFTVIEKILEESPDKVDRFLVRQLALDLGYNTFDELTNNGKYVEGLFTQKVSERSLEKVAARIKDLSIKRSLAEFAGTAASSVASSETDKTPATRLIAEFEDALSTIVNDVNRKNDIDLLTDGFMDLVNETADNPQDHIGLPTGFPRLDRAIGGGMRKGSITLVGARPKNFKSGLALNVARYLTIEKIHQGKAVPVLILDTELQPEYQKFRLGASTSMIPINKLETGSWRSTPMIVHAVEAASQKMKDAPLYHIYVGGFPIDRILATIKFWLNRYVGRNEKGEYKDCLVVYDYIKLMDTKEVKNDMKEWQLLGFHMTALQDLMVRADVAMLCMCQLNRDGSEEDNDTVFAGADRLIWFASNINILRNKKVEEVQEDGVQAGNMRIVTLISRFGPAMDQGDYLNLHVEKACMFAREGKLKSELQTAEVEMDDDDAEDGD